MDRKSRSRSEFFVGLTEKVKEIPVLTALGSLIQIYERNGRPLSPEDLAVITGGSYFALCPFHADTGLGSFVITPSKKMWWCFTEGIGWNVIHFEMRYFDLSFDDAVFHLAKRFSLLSEAEEKVYAGKKIDADVVKRVEASVRRVPKNDEVLRRAPDEVIFRVYNAIPKVYGLKEKHREHLLKVRGLAADELSDFFTFPTRKSDMAKKVFRQVADDRAFELFGKGIRGLSEDQRKTLKEDQIIKLVEREMKFVPGFFQSGNRIDFASFAGIGYPARDEYGNPHGIQVRRDDGDPRYVWFSSAFAAYKENCSGGCSPGAPGGVVFPKGYTPQRSAPVFITEGRFKAMAIARHLCYPAVYVSGVSSWKNIKNAVKNLYAGGPVCVAFDADMKGNTAVHGQLKALCDWLHSEKMEAVLLVWNIQDGKGFDDLVNNAGQGFKKKLLMLKFKTFEEKIYSSVRSDCLRQFGARSERDIPAERRTAFNNMMQNSIEAALNKARKNKKEE